jgi:hypothetical protein
LWGVLFGVFTGVLKTQFQGLFEAPAKASSVSPQNCDFAPNSDFGPSCDFAPNSDFPPNSDFAPASRCYQVLQHLAAPRRNVGALDAGKMGHLFSPAGWGKLVLLSAIPSRRLDP